MGVPGVWTLLDAAAERTTLEEVAWQHWNDIWRKVDEEGRAAVGPNDFQRLKVGVDASAWFFHSSKSEGGANPELRQLFQRVARCTRLGLHVLFVFDGPHRPNIKRGKRIYKGKNALQDDFVRIVEAFGQEWRVAPAEAEAELAMLNSRGDISLVITDDVDCLLFGADKVLKHGHITDPSNALQPTLYERGQVELETDLTVPGLILTALMSGGDYDKQGLTGVGPVISTSLAKAGFGDRLATAIRTLSGTPSLDVFLHDFREEIKHELRTNQSGYFERKAGKTAEKFHDDWPDLQTAQSYYDPVVSSKAKYTKFDKRHLWEGRLDLGQIVKILDELFEYTHKDIYRTLRSEFGIIPAIVVDRLIASLRDHRSPGPSSSAFESPSKKLAADLSSFLSMDSPKKGGDGASPTHSAIPASLAHIIEGIADSKPFRTLTKSGCEQECQVYLNVLPWIQEARQYLRFPDPNIHKLEERKLRQAEALSRATRTEVQISAGKNFVDFDEEEHIKLWFPSSVFRLACPGFLKEKEAEVQAKKDKKAQAEKEKEDRKRERALKAAQKQSPSKSKGKGKAISRKPEDSSESEEERAPVKAIKKGKGKSLARQMSNATYTSDEEVRKAGRAPTTSLQAHNGDVSVVCLSSSSEGESPRKSPRKSASDRTARAAASSQPPSSRLPGMFQTSKAKQTNPSGKSQKASPAPDPSIDTAELSRATKKVQPAAKKLYAFTELSDSELSDPPPLSYSLTRKASTKAKGKAKVGNQDTSSRSSQVDANIRKVEPVKAEAKVAQVVDLCSD